MKEEEFSILINRLIKKVYSIDRTAKICYGVTVQQCNILDIISAHGQISMNNLSKEMELAVSTLTRMMDILVRDKIVKRFRTEDDRRKVIVALTEKGKELAKQLRSCTLEYTKTIFNCIPEEKKDTINKSLDLLIEAIGVFKSNCCNIKK